MLESFCAASSLGFFMQDKVTYDISKMQYSKEIMYEGIHLKLLYSRIHGDVFQIDGVLTTDGQNILDLVRHQALKYFETLIERK